MFVEGVNVNVSVSPGSLTCGLCGHSWGAVWGNLGVSPGAHNVGLEVVDDHGEVDVQYTVTLRHEQLHRECITLSLQELLHLVLEPTEMGTGQFTRGHPCD